jgi:hypothetical protein
METVANVTPTEQDANLSFDSNGELQFSEEGLKGFKELLKEGVHDEPRPTVEAEPEEPVKEPEAEEPEAKPEPKKKIKVAGQEIEVTEEELIAKAQQGEDYTRKMQALAEKERSYAPYDALITQLRTDPNLSQHIARYWQPQPQAEPARPQFDDPIEQLKWETKQEALAEFRKEMQQVVVPLQQTQMAHARQQGLNQVKAQVQADPDYTVVHNAIIEMVKALPAAIQKNAYLQLDQDPASYLEAFQAQKIKLAESKKSAPIKQEKTTETKRTERAPILESSNSAPTEEGIKTQRAKIDKAKARALREGSVEALQNLLETGGFLDNLLK